MPPITENNTRLPSLDGWRALSIMMVLGAHCKEVRGFPPGHDPIFKWLVDGHLGVRVFFLISGLLITWLMLVEHDRTGRLNLGCFYARRALRILPVYFVFLGFLFILQLITPFCQSVAVWTSNLTFTTNFLQDREWASGHLWSLAVEEQFYFLWPSLFVIFGIAERIHRSWWILIPPVLIAPLVRVIDYVGLMPCSYRAWVSDCSFLNNFDSLAIGCCCGVLLARRLPDLQKLVTSRPAPVFFAALLLIFVPYTLSRLFLFGIVTVPFGYSLQILGVALMVLQSVVRPDFWAYSILNRKMVCWLGVLSYSVYIWQQFFCTDPRVFGLGDVWWMSYPAWIIPVLIAAVVSYYGLERPLFRLRTRFRQ